MQKICSKLTTLAAGFVILLSLTACTSAAAPEGGNQNAPSSGGAKTSEETSAQPGQPAETASVQPADPSGRKPLVVYFSCTGNTKRAAEKLAADKGADLAEIVPAHPYTEADLDWHNDKSRSSVEMKDKASRPAIKNDIDISKYDEIYIGYPIWWYTMPRIINTFVESHDLSGKTVHPFCTSGGSTIDGSVKDLRQAVPGAKVTDGERL